MLGRVAEPLVASVFGACDLYQLSPDLQTSARIADYNVWTQFLGVGVVGPTVYFTNYDQGMMHWLKSFSAQGTIASGLKNPAHFLYLPAGGAAYPDVAVGTSLMLR